MLSLFQQETLCRLLPKGIDLLHSREVCYTFYLSSLLWVRVTAVSVKKFLNVKREKKKKNIMSQTIRRCVPLCSRPISDYDTHEHWFECLCLSMASASTVSCSPLKRFALVSHIHCWRLCLLRVGWGRRSLSIKNLMVQISRLLRQREDYGSDI